MSDLVDGQPQDDITATDRPQWIAPELEHLGDMADVWNSSQQASDGAIAPQNVAS